MSAKSLQFSKDWVLVGRACILLACMYAVLFSFAIRYWPYVDVSMVNPKSAGNHVEVLKSVDGPPHRVGENGEPVYLHRDDELSKLKLIRRQMLNVYVSNNISYVRSIPDNRDPRCAQIEYDTDLPTASVIIPFHNEEWSTLMRTLWTVVKRSPALLLREILLVDDLSDKEEMGEKLDRYVTSHFRNVRVIHLKWRRGIAGARSAGAEAATGDVLVFLESHCEAGHQWLKPLLQRVKYEPNNIAVPWIDGIDYFTLGYHQRGPEPFGKFTWREHVSWRPHLVQKQNFDKLSPSDSEGVFAISRRRFWEITLSHIEDHTNDDLELSFRDIKSGEIYTRKTLKQKLRCQYFHWYLDKIFPQQPLLEEMDEIHGKIVNKASHNCIDTLMRDIGKQEPLGVYECQSSSEMQMFTINRVGEIRYKRIFCFDVFGNNGTAVRLSACNPDKGSQTWTFYKSGTIVHSATKKCLNEASSRHLEIKTCNHTKPKSREWEFQTID